MRVLRTYGHVAILVAVALIEVVYAFPGYMNYDAADQLLQARADFISDWHPPVIARYWQFFELIVEGPFLLLVLQLALFIYGTYSLLRLRFSTHPSAWITAAIVLFPPMFTTLAVVWKDSQMAGFLVAGTALAIRPHRILRVIGLLLLLLAAAVRHNAGAALPTLFFLALPMAWGLRRYWVRLAITATLLVVTFVATSALNRVLVDRRDFSWYKTTAAFDIVGIGCHSSMTSDEEFVKLLEGTGLTQTTDVKQHFCGTFPPGTRDWFRYGDLFEWRAPAKQRLARKAAWKRMIVAYPAAWIKARYLLAKDHLGLWKGVPTWEPVCQTFTGTPEQREQLHVDATLSSFQQWAGARFVWLAEHTPFYKPWIYLLAGLLLFGWAIWRRDLLVGCIVGSGLSYQLSILLVANAPDFRYAHWMITCTILGLALRYSPSRAQRAVPHES
ncbi:MAG: hypothetical protein AB7T06_01860 [Kofleriaceae bacterium]